MDLEFVCPHCKEFLIVNTSEINCGIFRHGVFKETNQQINPHETKANCDMYVEKNIVYGCAGPFAITKKNGQYEISICDYI
jgi:hypothetical protein